MRNKPDENEREPEMNFTQRLNGILSSSGIKVEAKWCNVVGSYSVECEYHNGFEKKEVCLDGIGKRTIASGRLTADEKAHSAALQIVDRILAWEAK